MNPGAAWITRAWPLYVLAGVFWVAFGSAVLGDPQGLGLIFIGLTCLALGVYGAGWRVRHGYGLRVGPPRKQR